jgi:hypothetical protein
MDSPNQLAEARLCGEVHPSISPAPQSGNPAGEMTDADASIAP